ncbi:MAG TPA: ATP-binding protein [Gemmatimonadaceae bacterium]
MTAPPSPPFPLLDRVLAPATYDAMGTMPVVAITGARQTGKSTLAKQIARDLSIPYLSLDDLDVRERAATNPGHLVREAPRLVLDEVQRVPDLLLAIKRAVDDADQRIPGQFLLTGSANLLMMRHVADSLAGRALYVQMLPLTRREQLGLGATGIWDALLGTPVNDWYALVESQTVPDEPWRAFVARGGFPRPATQLDTPARRAQWYAAYVETYLERDLRELAAIDNLVDFRRLMRAACLRIGNLVNLTELGRDVQLPKTTVHRYVNLLETSYQLVRIEPYAVNRTKRLIKTPKLYWIDAALAMHVAGETEPRGAHLETAVLADLLAWRGATLPRPNVLYWRTVSGAEVDFVIERGDTLLPIEVKTSATLGPKDAAAAMLFLEEYGPHAPGAVLLYGGTRTFWIAPRVLAAPWWKVV